MATYFRCDKCSRDAGSEKHTQTFEQEAGRDWAIRLGIVWTTEGGRDLDLCPICRSDLVSEATTAILAMLSKERTLYEAQTKEKMT